MRVPQFFREQEWTFAPHELSPLPGGASVVAHPVWRRIVYGLVGVLIGVTGGLGTALVQANLPYLQGGLGLYQNEIAWLPAVYVMTNVPTGMVLIKYRQQFGLRSFALIFQGLYCLLTFAHLFVHGFGSAIVVRAASGIAGSALTTLGLFYVIQAFPQRFGPKAIAIGIAVPQLAIPIARLFSSDLLAFGQWRTLYLFEFGLALLSFAAIAVVRIPPTVRAKSFEWLDFPTVLLFTIGITLVCSVLAVGRFEWWLDSGWIGWVLAAALPFFAGVFLIEYHRVNPIIDMRWIGTGNFLRFVIVGTVSRIVLSEQTYGSVGLLNVLGTTNDQLFTFAVLTTLAAVGGIAVSAWLVRPNHLTQPVALALAVVAVAAFIDTRATNLTRAPELYLTQMLISFATTLYIGPAILIGFAQVLSEGGKRLTSFLALFATTQSLGGLIGTALLSTYQSRQEKQHSFDIVEHLTLSDPLVSQTLVQGAGRLNGVLPDPLLRTAQGAAALAQRVTIEANVLAYNDVFRLISVMSALTTLMLVFVLYGRWRATHSTPKASPVAERANAI